MEGLAVGSLFFHQISWTYLVSILREGLQETAAHEMKRFGGYKFSSSSGRSNALSWSRGVTIPHCMDNMVSFHGLLTTHI